MGRASSTLPPPASFPAAPGVSIAVWAPLCLLSPFRTAEGGLFLTEEAASEAATVTNSLMMSLSVTGDEAIIIMVRGRWEFSRLDVLDGLSAAAAPSAAVEKEGGSWWWSCCWSWP